VARGDIPLPKKKIASPGRGHLAAASIVAGRPGISIFCGWVPARTPGSRPITSQRVRRRGVSTPGPDAWTARPSHTITKQYVGDCGRSELRVGRRHGSGVPLVDQRSSSRRPYRLLVLPQITKNCAPRPIETKRSGGWPFSILRLLAQVRCRPLPDEQGYPVEDLRIRSLSN